MLKIAIISDIHSNVPALEAAIETIEREGAEAVFVGGDLVGRGPQGDAVVKRIRGLNWPSVRGNHEDYLLDFIHRRVPSEWWSLPEWSAARWMAAELSRESAKYIENLPFSLEIDGGTILFHGTPRANNDGIGYWTSERCREELLTESGKRFLICGHTHRPLLWDSPSGRGTIVNAGSVGLTFDGRQGADVVFLERREISAPWEVTFFKVQYDIREVEEIYEKTGFLRAGGITSQLLLLELRHARPFLVPFIKWAKINSKPPTNKSLDEFLNWYDPDKPSSELFG